MIKTIAMKTTMVEAKAAVIRRMRKDYIDSGGRDESNDVILAFRDYEKVESQPQHDREEPQPQDQKLIFLSFIFSTNSERASTFLFC